MHIYAGKENKLFRYFVGRIFYKVYSERQMKKTVYLNLLGMVLQQLIGAAENERQLQLAGGAIPARCLFCNVAIAEQLNCNSYFFSQQKQAP